MPHPYSELSVSLHHDMSSVQIHAVGRLVAEAQGLTYFGRADAGVSEVRSVNLDVEHAPVANNPNHANVVGWPADKASQKNLAQQVAAHALFVAHSS